MTEKVIVTGCAGFIGFHTCKKLIKEGYSVLGLDNINDYYDKDLKLNRLDNLKSLLNGEKDRWQFIKCDIEDEYIIKKSFNSFNPDIVINLAAQAGVRYSIKNPKSFIKSNLVGFANILEACRNTNVKNLLYASSSSVYGGNLKTPFKETDITKHPISLYAATKSSNELMAQSYSHLYKIPCTGLRFFTVYGPWGRPDMAPMIFANAILNEKPIKLFNYGNMKRDFTYIDDIVEAIFLCCKKPAKSMELTNKYDVNSIGQSAPHLIFNIGNNKPTNLIDFVETIENILNIKAIKEYRPIEKGDVKETFANIDALKNWIGFSPNTSLEKGMRIFLNWYMDYYDFKIKNI